MVKIVRYLSVNVYQTILCCIVGSIFFTGVIFPQTNSHFNVNLIVDDNAVEQTIQLFKDNHGSAQSLAELRGNAIAASTTGLIADRSAVGFLLQSYLDSLKYHQTIKDDIFNLESARKSVNDIDQLLTEIKKRNFNRRVVATVEQIFPENAEVSITIPVYIVALGHENVDAYVRRIVWHGNIPEFVGESEGELIIVINLAQSVHYGQDLEERFVSLLGVVAHEVFHAAFGAYKDASPTWKRYYKNHHSPFDELLDITQNEGIAYYLSLDQRGKGYLPRDWYSRTREVFSTFNVNAEELLSHDLTSQRASELIRTANLSGYWESYGAMAGMFIAREIDLRLGRAALIETIAGGPYDMFEKYLSLIERDSNLPTFSKRLISKLQSK
jgi:hypothetical protein